MRHMLCSSLCGPAAVFYGHCTAQPPTRSPDASTDAQAPSWCSGKGRALGLYAPATRRTRQHEPIFRKTDNFAISFGG